MTKEDFIDIFIDQVYLNGSNENGLYCLLRNDILDISKYIFNFVYKNITLGEFIKFIINEFSSNGFMIDNQLYYLSLKELTKIAENVCNFSEVNKHNLTKADNSLPINFDALLINK